MIKFLIQKMYNLFRTKVLGTEQRTIDQETYISQSQRYCGAKATQAVNLYQNERRWKSNLIMVEVIA